MPTLRFLERIADVLARRLLCWLHERVAPGSREWLDALAADSECTGDGWQRLRWALGGVPLVWTINKRRQQNERTRGTMRARIVPGFANIAAIAGWYAVTIPATYVARDLFRCHLSLGHQPGGCQEHPLVFGSIVIGGGVLGLITALALRARFAAYWWSAFSASNIIGFIWFLRFGIADVHRYGATQSAMLMAATFGVVLAAMTREILWAEADHASLHYVGDSARAPESFLSRHRRTAYLIAGTVSFAMADCLIRMRDRPPVADNVNHYAVLESAMFAAILAGLIGRHGADSRPRAQSFDSDLVSITTGSSASCSG